MKIEYIKVGDYYFPDLGAEELPLLQKYGRLRLAYIKEYKSEFYLNLLSTGKLGEHLSLIEQQANDMGDHLVEVFKKKRNITEDLKAKDQMLWVQEMNNIENCVNEIIRNNVIYI